MALEPQASSAAATPVTLLDRILDEGRLVRDPDPKAPLAARGLIEEFVDRVVEQGGTTSLDVTQRIQDCIAHLDKLISAQLNEVLHHEDFQHLEASWRGLNDLVMNTETGTRLKLRLLNTSKADPVWLSFSYEGSPL